MSDTPTPPAGDLISREAAIEALDISAWKHQGTAAYSRGMDAGARHQSKQDRDAIRGLPAAAQGQEGEPVAWRWRPKGSSVWIYDPKPEWLEAQSLDEIDAEPIYAHPPTPAPVSVDLDALEIWKLANTRYHDDPAFVTAITALRAQQATDLEETFIRGMAHGQAVMPTGTLEVIDSPELVDLRAEVERLRQEIRNIQKVREHEHQRAEKALAQVAALQQRKSGDV